MSKVKSQFMFTDGTKAYSKFDKYYKKHNKGYVILGPPGIGKVKPLLLITKNVNIKIGLTRMIYLEN